MRCGTLRKLNGEKAEFRGQVGHLSVCDGQVDFRAIDSPQRVVMLANKYSSGLSEPDFVNRNLKLLDHPLRGVKEGDVLVSKLWGEVPVSEVLVNVVAIGMCSKSVHVDWRTFDELEEEGWTLKGQENVKVSPKEGLEEEIKRILTPPEPPDSRFHGGTVDWKASWTKEGLDLLVEKILAAIKRAQSEVEPKK